VWALKTIPNFCPSKTSLVVLIILYILVTLFWFLWFRLKLTMSLNILNKMKFDVEHMLGDGMMRWCFFVITDSLPISTGYFACVQTRKGIPS
jgi:hypothetical protein